MASCTARQHRARIDDYQCELENGGGRVRYVFDQIGGGCEVHALWWRHPSRARIQ